MESWSFLEALDVKKQGKHVQILSQRSDGAREPDRNSWMTPTLINPKDATQAAYEHAVSSYAILHQRNRDTFLVGEKARLPSQQPLHCFIKAE